MGRFLLGIAQPLVPIPKNVYKVGLPFLLVLITSTKTSKVVQVAPTNSLDNNAGVVQLNYGTHTHTRQFHRIPRAYCT